MVQISSVNISSHLVRFKDCANSTFPSFWSCSQNESSVNNYGSGRGLTVWEWKETLYYWNEQYAKPRGDCREMLRVLCPPSASKIESSGCHTLLPDARWHLTAARATPKHTGAWAVGMSKCVYGRKRNTECLKAGESAAYSWLSSPRGVVTILKEHTVRGRGAEIWDC